MNSFSNALKARKNQGYYPVIPDMKCRSPKEGDLLRGRNPVEVAVMLMEAGAPVLSVVTEEDHFGGSLKLLTEILLATNLPLLRKDFITEKKDLILTKESGASAILLICSMLPPSMLRTLYEESLEIGLEPLVEAHTKEELIFAELLGAKLVGINNRDIKSLEKDSGTVASTQALSGYKPPAALLISESGIQTKQDVELAFEAGADAVLVGTALWNAEDMATTYHHFSRI